MDCIIKLKYYIKKESKKQKCYRLYLLSVTTTKSGA